MRTSVYSCHIKVFDGELVPMPTLPEESIRMASVPAKVSLLKHRFVNQFLLQAVLPFSTCRYQAYQ